MLLFLDIETIPNQQRGALEAVRAGLRPPATLKKPESIANWWQTEAEGAAAEQWRKQALDGGTLGEIISVAVLNDLGDEWVRCRAQGEPEAQLLRDFFSALEGWERAEFERCAKDDPNHWPVEEHHLVAHNAAFDLGFIWRRCIVNQVPLPRWWPSPIARAGKDYTDTMTAWAGFGGRVSLDALCNALGVVSPKGELDGSQVFDSWIEGRHELIARYNLGDARAVAAVHHRLAGRGRV